MNINKNKNANRKLILDLNRKLLESLNKLLDNTDPIDIPAAVYSVITKIILESNLSEEELDMTAQQVLSNNTDSGETGITEEEIEELRNELRLVKSN